MSGCQIKSFVLLAVLCQTCNTLAGPMSVSLRPGNTAPFKEMLQRLGAIGNTVFDITNPRFEPQRRMRYHSTNSRTGKATCQNGFVRKDINLQGQIILITGANTGIGFEASLDFAERGAKVVMACRNLEKANEAKSQILKDFPNAEIQLQQLDLSSLDSVRECARNINETLPKLDVLVNNAGVMMCPPRKTKDGFEMQIGVNHIGHFLLTNLLLDLLKKSTPSRIIIVSSLMYKRGRLDFNDLMHEKNYDAEEVYSASKLANVMHCLELSKILKGTGVTCNCLHPGIIKTDLWRHMDDISHMPFVARMKMKVLAPIVHWTAITPKEGVQTTIYCAVAPELENVSGKYFVKCAEETLQSHAKNEEHAKKLWELSEEWTKAK